MLESMILWMIITLLILGMIHFVMEHDNNKNGKK